MSKGSNRRPTDEAKFQANYEQIFRGGGVLKTWVECDPGQPGVRVGQFTLRNTTLGILISHSSGEGGTFKESALADLIDGFYNREF